jgi:hypothetical protein
VRYIAIKCLDLSHLALYLKYSPFSYFLTVGFSLLAINGEELSNKQLPNGTDALDVLKDPNNYPVSLKFGRIKLKTNEKIMFASMFHT